LIVVASQVTLRTPDGERELNAGDVVAFPRGLAGGHGRPPGGEPALADGSANDSR
jgi:hypothetical protein